MSSASGTLALPRIFAEALARDGRRLSEIVRAAGYSTRKVSRNCERLRALLAGERVWRKHVTRFAKALGLDLAGVEAGYAEDELVRERLRAEWESWANAPTTPDFIDEAVLSTIVFTRHQVAPTITREEALDLARRIAASNGNRVFVPAFQGKSLLITARGEYVVANDYGARLGRRRLLRVVGGSLSFPPSGAP